MINAQDIIKKAQAEALPVYCIFDPLADDGLINGFFVNSTNAEYANIFLDTPLKHLYEHSPYIFKLNDATESFFSTLIENKASWGFIVAGAVNLEQSVQHWRSLLQVNTETGGTCHFRFYDSDVHSRMLSKFSSTELFSFLGPHYFSMVFGRNADETEPSWKYFQNPDSTENNSEQIASKYTPKQAPWWTFKEEYWAFFEDKKFGIMVSDITETLFEQHTKLAAQVNSREGIATFISRSLKKILEYGVRDNLVLEYFVVCCLLYGDDFPKGTRLGDENLKSLDGKRLAKELLALIEEKTA